MTRYCGEKDKLISRIGCMEIFSSHDATIVMETPVIPILDFDFVEYRDFRNMQIFVDFAARNKVWRIYRTLNGFRTIIDKQFDWNDRGDINWLKRFIVYGMDEKYLEFCLERKSFAARISPKKQRVLPNETRCIAKLIGYSDIFRDPPSDEFVGVVSFHDRACCKPKASLC